MMGVEGSYIRRRPQQRTEYAIEPNLDQPTCEISLQHMVNKMLPLCSQHDSIQAYVQHKSRYEHGLVA
jgi:gamma-tubulin complex component 2